MPVYEYRCNHCGQVFEKVVRWSEADRLPECPSCLSDDTRKQISSFASLGGTRGGETSSSSSCGSSGGFS